MPDPARRSKQAHCGASACGDSAGGLPRRAARPGRRGLRHTHGAVTAGGQEARLPAPFRLQNLMLEFLVPRWVLLALGASCISAGAIADASPARGTTAPIEMLVGVHTRRGLHVHFWGHLFQMRARSLEGPSYGTLLHAMPLIPPHCLSKSTI